MHEHQGRGRAHRRPGRAVDGHRPLQQQVDSALSVRQGQAQVLGPGLAVSNQVIRHPVGGVRHQGGRIDEGQLVGRDPAQVGVFPYRADVLGPLEELPQLRPVEPAAERKEVHVESLEVAELVALDRGLGQGPDLALEGRREVLALVEEARQEDERVQRLASRPVCRHKPARRRDLARLEDRLHAQRPGIRKVRPDRVSRILGDEERKHRGARPVRRALPQVEQRVERWIPAAPGDERGLPRGKRAQGPVEGGGLRIVHGLCDVEQELRGPDLFRVDQVPAKGCHRRRPRACRAQEPLADRFEADGQEPRHDRDHRAGEHKRGRGRRCFAGLWG